MDAQTTSFWQTILVILVGMLQQVVGLFVWERHKQVDNQQTISDNPKQ